MSDKILISNVGNFMPEVPKERPLKSLLKMCRERLTAVTRWQVVLGAALLLTFVSIALLATALSTEHWIQYQVDRDTLKNRSRSDSSLKANLKDNPVYFPRSRGLFRTCFTGSEALDMLSRRNDVTGNICMEEKGFTLNNDSQSSSSASHVTEAKYYDTRMHLLRTIIAFTMGALLLFFISIILGIVTGFISHVRLITFTGLIVFSGVIFDAFGLALFFVVQYLENKKISHPDFRAGWLIGTEHEFLISGANENYGYSVYLGWVSLVPAGIAIILCIVSASMAQKYIEEQNRPKSYYDTIRSKSSRASHTRAASSVHDSDIYYSASIDRNPAYDYAERRNKEDIELDDDISMNTSYS